jgi:GntR family transcriptional regulator of gluconate operon
MARDASNVNIVLQEPVSVPECNRMSSSRANRYPPNMISQRLVDPWERVRNSLRAAILLGDLEPGARLREIPLAERFEVSRGPVREAIRALEGEGLVVREPRFGSMVVPIDRRSADELYSLRLILEPFAARRALERRPVALLVRLSDALTPMRAAAAEDGRMGLVDPDLDFHTAFFRESEHERLLRIWESMAGPLQILLAMSARRAPGEWEATVLGHESIFAAAQERDGDRLVVELGEHLRRARSLVMDDLP